jgi:hypothetical protein
MFKNWKTSLFGLGALITGVAQVAKGDVPGGVTSILSGFGLFAAQDSTKSIHP